jgi:hypothetical protein
MSYRVPAYVCFVLALAWACLGGWSFARGGGWSWLMLIVCTMNGAFMIGKGVSLWEEGRTS